MPKFAPVAQLKIMISHKSLPLLEDFVDGSDLWQNLAMFERISLLKDLGQSDNVAFSHKVRLVRLYNQVKTKQVTCAKLLLCEKGLWASYAWPHACFDWLSWASRVSMGSLLQKNPYVWLGTNTKFPEMSELLLSSLLRLTSLSVLSWAMNCQTVGLCIKVALWILL